MENLIEKYQGEVEKFQFESFDSNNAWDIGVIISNNIKKAGVALVVNIIVNDQQLFTFASKGTPKGTKEWLRRKHNTVMYSSKSSILFGEETKRDGVTLQSLDLVPTEYVQCGGGFPITIKGEGVVGSICTSGLTDIEDHQFIIDGLAEYFK